MSSVPSPFDPDGFRQGMGRITDLPLEEIVVRLLEYLFDGSLESRLIDDLIDLSNVLSPHELGEVYRYVQSMTTEASHSVMAKHAPMWSPLINSAGAEFSRETLFDGCILYRSAVQAPVRPAMVCFTSRGGGMLFRNCRFLDILGRHPVDVIINSTETGSYGRWHIGGSRSFAGSLAKLKQALSDRGIRPLVYTGASAGGGPAVYAATLDAGTQAVLFGGRFYVPGRNIPLAKAGLAFEPICDCWTGPMPPVHNIFAALEPIDRENDQRLQSLVKGAQSVPLAGADTHSPMVTLTARRKLRPVLDMLVLAASGARVNFHKVIAP